MSTSCRILLLLSATLLAGAPARAVSSYAEFAVDEIGSSTGATSVGLGVPDYAFVNDAGEGFGGINADVFGPGEATVLAFPAALRDVAGQEDLFVSAFVGGLGETDDAHVQVEVSGNGVDFTVIDDFHTADGRTTYPFDRERDFSTVKHFAVDFAGEDFVTHVRLTNLAGTAEGLRLDAVEGLHPVVGTDRGFEIRFERYRDDTVERFLVRIKNLGSQGGLGIRGLEINGPTVVNAKLEETAHSFFGLDGEFLCVEDCVPDNADPPNRHSRHEWSVDGLVVAPAGVGLDPGRQASHLRFENFDIDHCCGNQGIFLAGFSFLVTFTDGTQHAFDWDTDVVGQDVTGMQYQKYLYNVAAPAWSTPQEVHYYEFLDAPSLACSNGLDDDGDGTTDYPEDWGCSSAGDDDERGTLPCDDGADNDGDGLSDFPDDPGCGLPIWTTEEPACDDGIDNDGDGQTDHPADPGCAAASSGNESPQCNDGVDNDGDGDVDTADVDCLSASDRAERPPAPGCGLGFELALVVPLLARRLTRRRRG